MTHNIAYAQSRLAVFASHGLTHELPESFDDKIQEFATQVAQDTEGEGLLPEISLSEKAERLLVELEMMYQEVLK